MPLPPPVMTAIFPDVSIAQYLPVKPKASPILRPMPTEGNRSLPL
jgi:hypothetical protein